MTNSLNTSTNPTHCPTCDAELRMLRPDRIRYWEAVCGYSTIGGVCKHDMTEQETQECRILSQLPPDVIRELQHFGGRDVVDLVAALVKADVMGQTRSMVSITRRVESINDTHGVQDADAIITEMLRGVQPIIEREAS